MDLQEADPDEPCEGDPQADHWLDTRLDMTGEDAGAFELGAGGLLALLVTRGPQSLVVRTSMAGGAWSDAAPLPGSNAQDYPTRVEVSSDGSTAVVLWRRDQQLFINLREADGSFAPAQELSVPQDVDMLAFPGQRVLLGHGSAEGIHLLEYTPSGGLRAAAPVFANYDGLFRDGSDSAVAFSASSFVTGPDTAHPYVFGTGFGDMQVLSARLVMPTASQTFFFALPNGRAMRLIRTWLDEATRGLHVTTRQQGAWGTEEHIGAFEGDATTVPAVAHCQDKVIVAWADEDANVTVAREHDGDAWQPEQTLPRSRGLQSVAIVGAEDSALLYGEQTISGELVSVKELYRRGSAGTWYCAKLLPNGFGSELVSDGTGFWFAERVRSQLHVSRFSP